MSVLCLTRFAVLSPCLQPPGLWMQSEEKSAKARKCHELTASVTRRMKQESEHRAEALEGRLAQQAKLVGMRQRLHDFFTSASTDDGPGALQSDGRRRVPVPHPT